MKRALLIILTFCSVALASTGETDLGFPDILPSQAGNTGFCLFTNGVTLYWAACLGGGGTVTSVDASVPSYMSISGNPITAAGTLVFDFNVQSGNKFFSSPADGSSGAMAMRAIVAADLPTVNSNVGTFGSSTSIPTFTVSGKGLITAASGNVVIAPAGTLTGTTLASNVVTSSLTTVGTIGAGVWQGTSVAIGFGGTGQTTKAAAFDALSPMSASGDIIYGGTSGTGTRLAKGSDTQILTLVSGLPAWAAPATSGTVTSVALTVPSIMNIGGSPITTSGTLAITLATESANLVFAGPTTGSAATPTFRSLVGADLPNPSSTTLGGVQSLAVVSSKWINTISTSGVPAATQPAFTDISGSVAAGQMPALTGDVTTSAGTVATTVAKIQGTTVSGTTGTTNVVFSGSPTIVTPTVTTSATIPLVIGGTGTTSTLTLQTTSGVGTTNADMIFKVGNNGATEAMRVLNSGSIGIGTTNPRSGLLELLNGSGNNQLVLAYSDTDSSHLKLATFIVDSAGALSIQPQSCAGVCSSTNTLLNTSGGYVGIGTATPAGALDVEGGTISTGATPIKLIAQSSSNSGSTGGGVTISAGNGGGSGTGGNISIDAGVAAAGTKGNILLSTNTSCNVGIGTTTPNFPLDVASGSAQFPPSGVHVLPTTHATSRRAGYAMDNWGFGQDLNGDGTKNFYIYDGNASATRMMISTAGSIGIATTAPASANNLQIGTQSSSGTATPITLSLGATYSSTAGANPKLKLYDDGTTLYGLGISGGSMDIMVPTTGTYNFYVNGTQIVKIDTSGNLGIATVGTGGPVEKLTLNGNMRIEPSGGTTFGTGAYIDWHRSAVTSDNWNPARIEQLWAGANYNGILVFATNGTSVSTLTERMRIDGFGHIENASTAPTVTAGAGDCGTSPSVVGNDNVGRVTVGSGANGGFCTITFAATWTNAPICVANDETTGVLVRATNVSTTAFRITGVIVAGDKLIFSCRGYR